MVILWRSKQFVFVPSFTTQSERRHLHPILCRVQWGMLKQFRLTLNQCIFIGLFMGGLVGLVAPDWAYLFKPFRTLFLNGIKCVIAPLIFSTLVTGIVGIGSVKELSKLGLKAIIFFEIVTTFALFVGLLVVNVLKPGVGLGQSSAGGILPNIPAGSNFFENLVPPNIIQAILKEDILQVVVFSSVFAISVLMAGGKAKPMVSFCEALAEIMLKMTSIVMFLAPLGVGSAVANALAEHGPSILIQMFKLVVTSYVGLICFVGITILPILKFFNIPIKAFFRELKSALFIGFATTSSEAAYPVVLDSLDRMKIPRKISSFVLPLGYSFNLDGSTLYLSVALIFIAQAANIDLSIRTQLLMMGSLMLTTKGVAAVPRATLVVLSGTLVSFGLPLDGLALIMAVDHILDMGRTFVNVLGNSVAAVVISQLEGYPPGLKAD